MLPFVFDSARRLPARWFAWLLMVALTACGGGSDGPGGPTSPPLSELTLFPDKRVAVVGEAVSLAVTARDVGGSVVTSVVPQFTSTNPAVVLVEPGGRLAAKAAGTAIVRATAGGKTAESTIYVGATTYDLATLGPPRIVTASYIDLPKIERISRFRSTVGHSYTDGSETCRSMKHYFQPKSTLDWTTVDVYSPVDGTIFGIAPDGAAGKQMLIRPRLAPVVNVTIFHVNFDASIVTQGWVNAGDHLGRHAAQTTYSDIAVSIGPKEGGRLISYFDAMTDAVFQAYQARGVASRSSFIITKAERDADPVPCVGESQFTVFGTLPQWVVLSP
jgi:hypothetical protein